MNIAVLYQTNSDHERTVLELQHEYEHRTGRTLVLQDVNTQDGSAMAELYGIMSYPAVIATDNNGQMIQLWQGEKLPLINEISYYDNQM